jgi:hypothetical protein
MMGASSGYHHAMQQDEPKSAASPGEGTSVADGTGRFVILGQTSSGGTFRPSDWAERLAGVMAAFRPRKAGGHQHLTYSPYVLPSSHRGIKCVLVDPELRNLEPMAYSFMLSFARDNDLVTEALPTSGPASAPPGRSSDLSS